MADRTENLVVRVRIHLNDHRARLPPQGPHALQRLCVRGLRWRDDAPGSRKQLVGPCDHTGLFLPGDRVGADKMHAARHRPLGLFDQWPLHTPDVCYDGTDLETRGPFLQMTFIGIHWRCQHDEVCLAYALFRIHDVAIDGTQLDRHLEVFDSPPDPDDTIGQPSSLENHAERATDETDADNGDLSEMDSHEM